MTHIDDPRIAEFLMLWHESGRRDFESWYTNLDYDSETYRKNARDRKKYIAFDQGPSSGFFLLDKETENIYKIKAYGVPNLKRCLGTLDQVISRYRLALATTNLQSGEKVLA